MYKLTIVLIVLVIITLAIGAFMTYRVGQNQKGDYENQGDAKVKASFFSNPVYLVYLIGTALAIGYVIYFALIS
ncbi:hypothetical protein [Guptibacillus algicola]|uniref:hypothetical protein n=1 Tax=Guptibacillus algicola TaxID=225844 RepID=UPI001CD362EF|nr:hypothetical protein [Alkalihalobacillus algicola]MCA0986434.1 hypothetical protein [Alkalihalobacillus algicola]